MKLKGKNTCIAQGSLVESKSLGELELQAQILLFP